MNNVDKKEIIKSKRGRPSKPKNIMNLKHNSPTLEGKEKCINCLVGKYKKDNEWYANRNLTILWAISITGCFVVALAIIFRNSLGIRTMNGINNESDIEKILAAFFTVISTGMGLLISWIRNKLKNRKKIKIFD